MARKTGSHAKITGPRIQAAALSLFARHGFAAVSMRKIAAEVGVQAGALYLYTKDKQSLLFDLMRTHMQDLLQAWQVEKARKSAQNIAGPRENLARFCRFHIDYHLERPDAVFIAYMELRSLTPKNFATIEALRQAYENELEAILQAGCITGDFRIADTKLATLSIIAMLTGVTTWYRDEGRLNRQEVAAIYGEMAYKSVAA